MLSGNPAVVFVSDDGTVSSVGAGETYAIATHTLGGQQKQLFILATVEIPRYDYTLKVFPAALNFGEQTVGTSSSSRQITITNISHSDIKITTLQGYTMDREDCSNTTLPPRGSCTIAVTFTPKARGTVHWTIYVGNSETSILTIPLHGKGI